MNAKVERDILGECKVIADGVEYQTRNVLVAFLPDNLESLTVAVTMNSGHQIPANSKTLLLAIDGMDTPISVLRLDALGSLVPSGEHFHLKVPDLKHREILAKYIQSSEHHPK